MALRDAFSRKVIACDTDSIELEMVAWDPRWLLFF